MKIDNVSRLMVEAIADGATPGAVILTGTNQTVTLEEAFGRLSYDDEAPPAQLDTIYDLASLTKVMVTTPLAMLLHERGQLALEAPVARYVPEFSGGTKDDVTVVDLLAHCGGLLWWTDLYNQVGAPSAAETKRGFIENICARPLDYTPRTKTEYSDLGFMLLGEILERVTQSSLDRLADNEIFGPLGMTEIRYDPPESLRSRIAPTENDEWRGSVLRGVVHDENAYAMGGVAPHSGLFSMAESIVPYAQMLLNCGASAGEPLFGADTVRRFTTRASLVAGSSRALGWDTPATGNSSGTRFSATSYGHTGFTGTSLWIDPQRNFFAIVLTNRVHPTRENSKLPSLRPKLHDALLESLQET